MTRFVFAAFGAAFLMPVVAQAQPQQKACMPFEQARKALGDSYGESVTGVGIAGNGKSMLAILSNPETGTWTALVVSPEGVACGIGGGEDWQVIKPEIGDPS